MSDYANGSQRSLRYVAEATWNTTPETPTMKILRSTKDTLAPTRGNTKSAELRGDRGITDVRLGNKRTGGQIGSEFSYEGQEDLLESALYSAFATTYNVTGASITVAATAKTYTRATGDYLADGVMIGDKITFSGFAKTGNNGVKVVANVSALVVTVTVNTGLEDESGGGNEAFTTTQKRLKIGTTEKSFTIERAFTDIGQYEIFTGQIVAKMGLSVKPETIVGLTFDMVGGGVTYDTDPLDADPTAAATGSPFDSFTGSILEGGTAIAIVTSLDLSLNNSAEPRFALMDQVAKFVSNGRGDVTGSLSAYFADQTLKAKFLAETESSLVLTLLDLVGVGYRITLPRMKYLGADNPVNDEGPVTQTLPIQALTDATQDSALIVDKLV
jgi:hypothetical protein